MRIPKPPTLKLAPGAPPMGPSASLGVPKLPRAAGAGPVKPHLRARRLSTSGKSAFGPHAGAAFPTAGAEPGPAGAFGGPSPMQPAQGDTGD